MRMKHLLAALAAGFLLANAGTNAAEVGKWYVSPSALYVDDDEDRGVEDDFTGAQLTIGYAFAELWNIEFFGNVMGFDDDTGGNSDQDQFELGANLLLIANRDDLVSPYFLLGTSFIDTEFDDDGPLSVSRDKQRWGISAGGGFMFDFGDSPFTLRTEFRLRKEVTGTENQFFEDYTDAIASIGLDVALGERRPKSIDSDGDGVSDDNDRCPNTPLGASVDENGCEIDSDGDGVADSKDQCPDTPAGTPVDARGCPEKDSDGDGVVDSKDKCPNTAPGARVDADGCEFDDDGDGVVNSADKCPNTPRGVRVDVNGCEIKEVINLPGVTFETNSDRLLPGAEQVLDDAAATLRKYPDLVIEVAGHTDSDGTAAYNDGLSERRAMTVLNYLVDRGANASNLSAQGYGESQPVADNATATGKARNRRVELRILNQ